MAKARILQIAACAARLRSAGREIQLMPAGQFRARDGRPHGIGHWRLDAAAAERLIALAHARRTPFVIDYEHQTLTAETSGQPAPAAGWFSRLEWREGDGLYAVDVEWTARARGMIDADEYRYLSPVFTFDPQTGVVRELLMAAVTNNPAIDGIADLAAARFSLTDNAPQEDPTVDEATLKALGLAKDATDEQIREAIAALTARAAKSSELEAQLAAAKAQPPADPDPAKYVPIEALTQLQQQVAALSSQVQGAEVERLVSQGLADGRLLPAMEDWARSLGKQDVAALRAYLDAAQPIAALTGSQTDGKPPVSEQSPLSEVEQAVCRQLGITEAEFLKSKEAN